MVKKTGKKGAKKGAGKKSAGKSASRAAKPKRAYPRATLEDALKIPHIIKEKNGGNPWEPNEVAKALGYPSKAGDAFFYQAAAARDFGLTKGGRDSAYLKLLRRGGERAN